jgi:hypothetical protein
MKLPLFIFIFWSSSFCQVAKCEIYKWRDKDGKLHYSEKKPEIEQEVRSLDVNSGKKFVEVENDKPLRSTIANSRHIVIVRPENFWDISQPSKMTTSYFLGGDCVSGVSVSFQDMKDNHPYILPRMNQLVDYVIKPIQQLDYSVSSSNKSPLARNLARYEDPLVLRFDYSALQLHLCLFNLKQRTRTNGKKRVRSEPFDFSVSDYNRRRANMEVSWRLEDPNTRSVLYQSTTSGSANYWLRDIHKYKLKVFKEAFKNSTNNLFADPKFIQLLNPSEKRARKSPKKIAIPKLKERGLFESLQNQLASNTQKKSKFANVLASVSPLKMMTVEYYLSRDEWPKRLSDIGVTRTGMFDDQYVKDIQFDFDGSIVLSLDENEFEENAMLSLQPRMPAGGVRIDWQCLTNLDSSYYGDICSTVE